eukprot:GHVU01216810.1.p1 GENE.GHVU01216810.1~~GHVU01216810.1.p1  ORF type:complete len:225 (-),score=29.07 GHVU01216810.1:155-829(-)
MEAIQPASQPGWQMAGISQGRDGNDLSQVSVAEGNESSLTPVPAPDTSLHSMTVAQLRVVCREESVRGTRKDGTRKKRSDIIELIENHRKATASIERVSARTAATEMSMPSSSSSSSNTAALPPQQVSSLHPQDSRPSRDVRLLNILFSDRIRDQWVRSGDKPTKQQFDERETGGRAKLWTKVAQYFNQEDADVEFDTFVPRSDGGMHPFLRERVVRMGPTLGK